MCFVWRLNGARGGRCGPESRLATSMWSCASCLFRRFCRDPSLHASGSRSSPLSDKLELIFVGGLVPYKACDLALRAAASLLRTGRASFTIVGDGPERASLDQLAKSLGIEKDVVFCGMLPHAEVMRRLGAADVLVFPSIHEF